MPNYHKNSKRHPANISIYQPDVGELRHAFIPGLFMIKSCHLAAYCQLVTLVCYVFWSTSMRLRVVWAHLWGDVEMRTIPPSKLLTGSSGSSPRVSGEMQHFPTNAAHTRIIQMDLKRIVPKTNCPAGERLAALSRAVWPL